MEGWLKFEKLCQRAISPLAWKVGPLGSPSSAEEARGRHERMADVWKHGSEREGPVLGRSGTAFGPTVGAREQPMFSCVPVAPL